MWRYESVECGMVGNEFSYYNDEPMTDDCWGFNSFDTNIQCEEYYLDESEY